MEIEIHIAGWSSSEASRVADAMRPKIHQALPNVSFDECRVARLVVADEANYGTVIDRLSPGETYTRNHEMLGVGKTLGYRDAQGAVHNCIVIHANMISALVENSESGPRPDLPALEWERALYVIPHELGHCRDNIARPSNLEEHGRTIETVFKIGRLNEVKVRIAISEYAACFHSAASMSPALFLDEFRQYGDWCQRVWTDVHSRRKRYSGPEELFDLAVATGSAAWFTLTQVCRILGLRTGNHELETVPLDWTQWLGSTAGQGFRAAEPPLAECWRGYPNQLEAFRSHLIKCWWELTQDQGFDFREGAGGDSVYFS